MYKETGTPTTVHHLTKTKGHTKGQEEEATKSKRQAR